MHKYQFAVTYKDRKRIHMLVTTQQSIHTFKKSNLQYTVDRETIDVLSFISSIHFSIILGASYAYYNVTHQHSQTLPDGRAH